MKAKTLQELKFAGVIAVYALVLIVSIMVLKSDGQHGRTLPTAVRLTAALAPMIPALLIVPLIIQSFRLMDEMQVRHQLEALAAAAGVTAFLGLGYGFLELVGFPKLSMFAVWGVMNGLWITAVWIQRWRYR